MRLFVIAAILALAGCHRADIKKMEHARQACGQHDLGVWFDDVRGNYYCRDAYGNNYDLPNDTGGAK